jgi:hypothetical protein
VELSNIIQYERLFSLELLHPVTDEPLGIAFQIRSAGSKEAKAILRKHTDANIDRQQRRKMISGAMLEQQEAEKAASYIASWNWGDHTWRDEKPVLTVEKAAEILKAEGWIYVQVTEAANTVANFIAPLETNSPKS